MNAQPKNPQRDNRQHYYTMLAIGKAELKWDDEFYYGIWLPMQGATKKDGKYSASTMSIGQLSAAVEQMRRSGFKPKSKKTKYTHDADWRKPRIAKLNAMWIKMADAGAVEDRSQDALETWCKRHHKKDRLQWCSSAELDTCVNMLTQWAQRLAVAVK
ncbi:MAG: regulatory protein GemA [Methylovulum miyakonense]|uniref:phage protein GemA/Gp16 family protein n=1 Tax=Methylovulum miyakonense TaxID=645578 RepID=UPI003BB49346